MIRGVFLLLFCGGFASPVWGQPAFVPPPVGVPPGKSGLRIDIFSSPPASMQGLRPLRITLTRQPAKPATKDVTFDISLHRESFSQDGYRAKRQLTIPSGKISAAVEFYVPIELSNNFRYYGMDTRILVEQSPGNGTPDRNDLLNVALAQVNGWVQSEPTWLVIDSKSTLNQMSYYAWPDMPAASRRANSSLAVSMETSQLDTTWASSPLLQAIDVSRISQVPPEGLPAKWQGYDALRGIAVSPQDLQQVCQSETDRLNLLKWIASGGHLLVADFQGDRMDHLEESLMSLLGSTEIPEAMQPIWEAAESRGGSPLRWRSNIDPSQPEFQANEKFALRPMGAGTFGVARDIRKFNFDLFGQLEAAQDRLRLTRLTYSVFHERSEGSPIPGVGEPPILLFCVFIVCFLTLAGPAMVILLRRMGHRQYLFLGVPVFSFLTCLLLLGYAIVRDYGTQMGRVETLTVLDTSTGMAYTEAIAAYYSGNPPPYYQYAADVVCRTSVDENSYYRLITQEQQQRLSGSHIQPRRNHEVLTQRSTQTNRRLLVRELQDTRQVVNQLGTPILSAVVVDKGQRYLVEQLNPGEVAVAKPITPGEAIEWLRKYLPTPANGFFSEAMAYRFPRNNQWPDGYFVLVEQDPFAEGMYEDINYELERHLIYGR